MQEDKMVVWGGFTNSWRNKKDGKQGRNEKVYPTQCRVPENCNEIQESLLQWTMQRNRKKTTEGERLDISSRKLEISKEYFMQEWSWKRTETVRT